MGRRIAYRLGRQQSFDKALGRIPWLPIRNRTLFPHLSPVLFLGHFQILPTHCRAVNAKDNAVVSFEALELVVGLRSDSPCPTRVWLFRLNWALKSSGALFVIVESEDEALIFRRRN